MDYITAAQQVPYMSYKILCITWGWWWL